MKTVKRYILLTVLVAMAAMHAAGQTEPRDTIYFYQSWQQMLDMSPAAMIVDPMIVEISPAELGIDSGFDEINDRIVDEYIALSAYDSIWFINSDYLRREFSGDVKNVHGFAQLYFNDKTAFLVASAPLGLKDILMGNDSDGYTSSSTDYYYIDFRKKRVERVTSGYLSELLDDYHDLLMRYEGMRDYKKSNIIKDYFFKYIDRATDDIMRPYIVDLVY